MEPNRAKSGDGWLVIDNFLSEQAHRVIWQSFRSMNFLYIHADGLLKIFSFDDGQCLRSEISSRYEKALDHESGRSRITLDEDDVLTPLASAVLTDPDIARFLHDIDPWALLRMTHYIYPPGSGAGWHSDVGQRAAFIYYAHPEWSAAWGGELMIANPSSGKPDDEEICRKGFDYFRGDRPGARSLDPGIGTYLQPVPNRVVLIRGGAFHAVKKVEKAAGLGFRASISGFLGSVE